MNRKAKKDLGYEYYVIQGLTAKETAEKCRVNTNTVGRWVKDGNWRDLRSAKNTASKKLIRNYYDLLNNIVEERLKISNSGESKTTYSSLTNEMRSIQKNIDAIEKDKASLSVSIAVIDDFMAELIPFLEPYNIKNKLLDFWRDYVINLAKKQ